MLIYLIGSLRNPAVPEIAADLRKAGFDVFDDWHAAGSHADDAWRDYEKQRGHDYETALRQHAAQHTFRFDQFHLNRAHAAVIVLPAGKSAHLEAGRMCGQNKPVWLLLQDGSTPSRLDVMTAFLEGVCATREDLIREITEYRWPKLLPMPMLIVEDILWLAGLLEGEGSFCLTGPTPRLVLQMTDRDVVAHAARLFDSKVWTNGRKTKGNKDVWGCGRSGLSAIEWMRILRPYLGQRRQQQIANTVQGWLAQRVYNQQDNVLWRRWFGLPA